MSSESCVIFDRCVVPDRFANHVLVTAHHAREHYFAESDFSVPEWDLVLGVFRFIEFQRTTPCVRLRSLLTDTKTVTLPEFASALRLDRDRSSAAETAFTGNREFSMDRFAAMVSHVTSCGLQISRPKLETILYYSDMVNYVLYSVSISGSKYVRHRFRPGMEDLNSRIAELVSTGTIRIDHCETHDENIVASDRTRIGDLSMLEIVSIHWVLKQMGKLTEEEVLKYIDGEHSHRFTRLGEFIAYEYGRLIRNLPETLN